MVERGRYRKGRARRDEILDTALNVIARVGYGGATVRKLAEAVGMSQSGLLHHFGTKDDLFAEILRRSDGFDVEWFTTVGEVKIEGPADLAESFIRVVRHHQTVPGLIPLYIRNSAEASDPDHPDHEFFRSRLGYAHRVTADAFDKLQRAGRVGSAVSPDVLATLILALQDGLRLQWLFDSSIDMPEHVAAFFALLDSMPRSPTRPTSRLPHDR